ncbi:MAG TPA: glycosyltransferase family 1 protein [Clostridiales bacterium]|nr:glycosyltransferase family 1 protein [Clostridiales bacterium]
MEKKIKIALLLGNISLGGVTTSVMNYVRNLDLEKFEMDFYVYGDSSVKQEMEQIGNVYYLPSFINFPKTSKMFNDYLKEKNYDIVHSHLSSLSYFPLKVAYKNKIEHRICHSHSTSYFWDPKSIVKQILKKPTVKYATSLLACSNDSAKWLYGKKANKALVINNAIEIDKFKFNEKDREKIRKELNIDGFCLAFFGRFEYQKNTSFLIKFFNELVKKIDAKLLIIGKGSDYKKMQNLINKFNLYDRVILLEPKKDIEKYYSAADVFCLPSRFEGLPMVGVEALANGMHLVCSNRVSKEMNIVKDYVHFIELNIDLWVKKIIEISKNYTRKETIELEDYDIKNQAIKLERFYENLVH